MKRKSLVMGILFTVFFIIYCGENGLEVGSITDPALDANFSKKSDQWLAGSEVLSMRPILDKFTMEVESESESREVRKITGISRIEVKVPDRENAKYIITGDIEKLLMEHEVIDGKPGIGKIHTLKGNIEWKEAENKKSSEQ